MKIMQGFTDFLGRFPRTMSFTKEGTLGKQSFIFFQKGQMYNCLRRNASIQSNVYLEVEKLLDQKLNYYVPGVNNQE
uniref:Uncharacterized protein n=1 Tax=Echinococcus canadensis TaxID=519352 RepID=A0A915EVL7_9CEST